MGLRPSDLLLPTELSPWSVLTHILYTNKLTLHTHTVQHSQINWESFHIGTSVWGNLTVKIQILLYTSLADVKVYIEHVKQ